MTRLVLLCLGLSCGVSCGTIAHEAGAPSDASTPSDAGGATADGSVAADGGVEDGALALDGGAVPGDGAAQQSDATDPFGHPLPPGYYDGGGHRCEQDAANPLEPYSHSDCCNGHTCEGYCTTSGCTCNGLDGGCPAGTVCCINQPVPGCTDSTLCNTVP
jgi:hypothetical protein